MKRFSKFIQESVKLDEKLKASDDMGDWVKDFQDSDAPQFKGKSQKKRQQMAIAAKLDAEREAGMRKEAVKIDEERKSSSYQFTHKPGDAESEKRLTDLKKSVKGTGKRVVLQGRLGKDNPNAHKYSKDAPSAKYKDGKRVNSDVSGKSGGHSHQRIQKADAAHHDVYVYNRRESVELDELKRSTLASYVKKAAGVGDRNSLPNAMRDQMTAANMGDKEWYKDSQRKANMRGMGIQRATDRLAKEEVELDESTIDKNHPIAKEYFDLKKKNLKDLKDMITQRSKISDTSEFRSKEHAASHLIRRIHGDKKVDQVFGFNEEVELGEALDLRITKVYNKFPKKATYAVHSSDRKYYKEFDSMEAAKAHHAEKTGK